MLLTDAAHALGLADQANMQRAFKVRHAMTPGNYLLQTLSALSYQPYFDNLGVHSSGSWSAHQA